MATLLIIAAAVGLGLFLARWSDIDARYKIAKLDNLIKANRNDPR